jgi:hypothetical protein
MIRLFAELSGHYRALPSGSLHRLVYSNVSMILYYGEES